MTAYGAHHKSKNKSIQGEGRRSSEGDTAAEGGRRRSIREAEEGGLDGGLKWWSGGEDGEGCEGAARGAWAQRREKMEHQSIA